MSKSKPPNTDPRRLEGSIAGPGGPYDHGAFVIDLSNALILDGCEVAMVDAINFKHGTEQRAMVLKLEGRINQTEDRANVMVFLNEDGAAGIVTELIGLATRGDFRDEFMDRVEHRLKEMPDE